MSDAAPKWTPEQQRAIEDRGHDLIVSAAAGSGKTAVLTERVLGILTGAAGDGPVPLERMLIITFTRKAAAEMRGRIEAKIEAALRERPGDLALREALDAMPRANILTLNAFCDRLARRHFHKAGLAPATRITDEDEEAEISSAAARDALARRMRGETPAEREAAAEMAQLLASTPPARGQDPLAVIMDEMGRLRNFLASLDDPEGWTARVLESIERTKWAASFAELPGIRHAALGLAQSLNDLAEALDVLILDAEALLNPGAVPEPWREAQAELTDFAERFGVAGGAEFPALRAELEEWWAASHGELLLKLNTKGKCGAGIYAEKTFLEQRVERLRKAAEGWVEKWLGLSLPHELIAAERSAWRCGVMLELALEADALALETRRRRGVATFADMERAALRLLRDAAGTGPSEVAAQMREVFAHVLVDEYQDISPLQDALIKLLSRTDDPAPDAPRNLFIVGDLKQSIYRFRRAEPTLFSRRMAAWGRAEAAAEGRARIDLQSNFRSRPGVLHGVNAFFERTMDYTLGDLDYDATQRLDPRREDPPTMDPVCVEVRWLMRGGADADEEGEGGGASEEEGEDLAGIEREAAWIAARIAELRRDPNAVVGKDGKTTRAARGGDCAILVRRLAHDAEVWSAALARHGVRVAAGAAGSGLLDQPEVIELHMALRVVDQPLEDGPLAVLLRSPMIGLDDSEILRLRMLRRDGAFHEAVFAARNAAADLSEPLAEKMRVFFASLEGWRRTALQEGTEAALDRILRETGYESYLAGLPGGAARIANVRGLAGMAREHAARAFGMAGLGGFLRHLAEARGRAMEEDGEGAAARDEDAVRILTVHKSKGLEFPIVFLPRLCSPFARSDRGAFVLNAERGISADGVDAERRLRLRPTGATAMREAEARAGRAEELRLLYVAMTRARDRLIMLGEPRVKKSGDELRAQWIARAGPGGGVIPALERLRAATPADLIGPVFAELDARADRPAWLKVAFENEGREAAREYELKAARAALLGVASDGDAAEWEAARREFARAYPAAADEFLGGEPEPAPPLAEPPPVSPLSRVPMKIVASSLRREGPEAPAVLAGDDSEPNPPDPEEEDARREPVPRRGRLFRREALADPPRFITARRAGEAKGAGGAAARGTLTHAILRRVDLRGALDEAGLRAQAAELLARGLLDAPDPNDVSALDGIPFAGMAWFFTTPRGRLMTERPGSVLREAPFRHWIPAGGLHEIGGDGALTPMLGAGGMGRPVLVQGVVDCIIDEGSAVTIIDYKTDRVRSAEEMHLLTAHYFAQLDEYRRAITACWRIPARSACLVFLDARKIVEIE